MSFFDDLTKKAKVVASVASEKAKEAADTAKISAAIVAEKRELDKNYKAIGEWFVSEYAEEIPEAVKDVVEAVNASKAKIAELEASKPQKEEPIAEEEPAERVCPVCGVTANSKFCPECGAPMSEPKE